VTKQSKMVRRRPLSAVTSGTNGVNFLFCFSFFFFGFINLWFERCFRKVQGEQEVKVRAKDVATCPECDEVIEDGQERTIVSGTEWHKW
jgi:hypothetical protein